MASLILGAVGTSLGAGFGGSLFGLSGATIGGMIGAAAGGVVDSWIVSALTPAQRVEGARLDRLQITSAAEGGVIPRLYGRMRIGGNIIWATDFRETVQTERTRGGGKGGGGQRVVTTRYLYDASFAVALCEGPIAGIGRVWADGELLDLTGVTWRWYPGDAAQAPDPFIAAKMRAETTPAYRGVAYVVFEALPLAGFGNRIPQMSFEVFRPIEDADAAEGMARAVTLIPATGEFALATEPVRRTVSGESIPENANGIEGVADLAVALDRLQAAVPGIESVSLVVAWFDTDLRCGECAVQPRVEFGTKTTSRDWKVGGYTRANAAEVSRISGPDDFTYLPEEIAEGNPAFNPTGALFSAVPGWTRISGSGSIQRGQGSFPVDVATIFASASGVFEHEEAVQFAAGQAITLSFDYAAFADDLNDQLTVELIALSASGAVLASQAVVLDPPDATIRQASVAITPSADVARVKVRLTGLERPSPSLIYVNIDLANIRLSGSRRAFAPGTRPAFGGTPADFAVVQAIQEIRARGLRVTFYPFLLMDVPPENTLPNPYSDNTEAIGQPAFPWRGRITCSPAPGFAGTVDKTAAAASQVAAFFGSFGNAAISVSGTTVNWTAGSDQGYRRMILHYARLCAAAGGVDAFLIGSEMRGLTTIRSDASSYPAVQALRMLLADVRAVLGPGTKLSYAADWSEYFGHQPSDSSGDVFFHLDPLWSHPACDFVGIDNYMPLADWRDGWDHLDAQDWDGIHDPAYLASNIEGGEGFDWFYASPADRAAQERTAITDGAYGKPWMFRPKDLRSWWTNPHFDRPGGVESGTPTAWVPRSKPIWFTELGCAAIDRGPNQPNVFFDPKSSESQMPHFSRGWRDDTVQRTFLEAHLRHWQDPDNNPLSTSYPGRMIEVPEIALWTWDARPYPFFPALEEVWSDGENWRRGHWLTGRLGAVQLGALVRELCLRAGLDPSRIDVSGLWGAVEGFVIGALESPRASIAVLGRHFGFDACESEGRIVFRMRGGRSALTLEIDDLVAAGAPAGEPFEITRGQESELPQALKWQIARADDAYDPAVVEARRSTVAAARVASEAFPLAVPPEEAERRVRRALMEAWTGRETATFALPPSRLALDPSDVVALQHDGRRIPFRLTAVADGAARRIEAVAEDRDIHDLPPGTPRSGAGAIARASLLGPMDALFLDLPILSEAVPEHHPWFAATARPWPGSAAVYRSPSAEGGFTFVGAVDRPALIGTLVEPLPAGPTSRFDHGAVLLADLPGATLASVPDVQLFDGANAFALEGTPGAWEMLQAGTVELVAPGRYRLSRLLRGQRGTEGAIADPAPAGARIVVLDAGVVPLPVTRAELGLAAWWRSGPASRPVTDETFLQRQFTPAGRGLVPFSVCHVEQPYRTGREPGDLVLRWKRRARVLAADSWSGLEIPLGEEVEAYTVEILDQGTVRRVLETAKPSVVYSEAQQIADFGSPLWPGFELDLRIRQVSAFGPGAPVSARLHLAGEVPWQASARHAFAWSANQAGWGGYSLRCRVADTALTHLGGYAVRALLQAAMTAPMTIGEAWIGLGSPTGTWHFDGPPVRLRFGGADGITIPAGAKVFTDAARLVIPAGRAVIVSVFLSQTSSLRQAGAGAGIGSRWWQGNNAAAISPAGGGGTAHWMLEGIDTI